MGVFHPDLVGIQVRVLERLGSRRVMIVHGLEGLDEISLSGPTMVGELRDGKISEYEIRPGDFGLSAADGAEIRVASVDESKATLIAALENRDGPARDIVALNAGASIYTAASRRVSPTASKRRRRRSRAAPPAGKLDEFVAATRDV
jgi:anthranilate phosphoribosyltransferase